MSDPGSDSEGPTDASYVEVEVPILDVPSPPPELSYPEMEDHRQRELLRVNGEPTDPDELVAVLDGLAPVFRAWALHTIGAASQLAHRDAVARYLQDSDDNVRVEAAWALARHGDEAGRDVLVGCLELDPVGYLAPAIAAGYLAQLGDHRGFPVVRRCVGDALVTLRMLGCKQLYHFVPAHGEDDGAGGSIDVWSAFGLALGDSNGSVAWQAFVQLDELAPRHEPAMALLRTYAETGADESLREAVRSALQP